ncbi:MAG: hypothetical protein QXO17_02495 [Nitrososphaerota archaeon]|nr:hypothetical protein [Candidatus Calditenuis fumarioli]
MRDELVPYSIAATSVFWGAAALVDPRIGLHPRLPPPEIVAVLHFLAGLLIVPKRVRWIGCFTVFVVTAYYSVWVKPFAPIAEPQTIGISMIALGSTIEEVSSRVAARDYRVSKLAITLLMRGGIAYPFVEWGLDALRNPKHFVNYISSNERASTLANPIGIENAVFLIFLVETVLATLIATGLLRKLTGIVSALVLTLFSAVAGYPLALPQNVVLIATSIRYGLERSDLRISQPQKAAGCRWLGVV